MNDSIVFVSVEVKTTVWVKLLGLLITPAESERTKDKELCKFMSVHVSCSWFVYLISIHPSIHSLSFAYLRLGHKGSDSWGG